MRLIKSIKSQTLPLGLGTWPMGGLLKVGSSSVGREFGSNDSERIVRSAIDSGISFIDTANIYGNGLAEKRLGDTLPKNKEGIVVCTKFGYSICGDKIVQDFSAANVRVSVDKSLANLKMDCLDILLVHSPPGDFNWNDYDPHPFEELVKVGKIKAFGVSCSTIKSAEDVIAAKFGTVIEVVYNITDRRAERLFPIAEHYSYDVICRMPLAYGFIAREPRITDFPPGDHRLDLDDDSVNWLQQESAKYNFLDSLSGGIIVSALRFAFSDQRIGVAVVGISSINHLNDLNLALELGELSSEVLQEISKIIPGENSKWGIQ